MTKTVPSEATTPVPSISTDETKQTEFVNHVSDSILFSESIEKFQQQKFLFVFARPPSLLLSPSQNRQRNHQTMHSNHLLTA